MARLELAINGRFTTRAISGVERFAYNITAALGEIAREHPEALSVEVIVPARAASFASPPPADIPVRAVGLLTGHAWEQCELPRACRGKLLFSPCNTGPVAVRHQVVTIHDAQVYQTPDSYSWPFRTWYKLLLPRLARRSEMITTDSVFSRDALRAVGVLPPTKGDIVHAAVDHYFDVSADESVLARHDIAAGKYILAIGSLSPHKNIRTVADAMAQASTRYPLIVAGGGNSDVFADAGLPASDRVRFIGRVTDAELRALYENAATLVFPSFFEGFGLPPLEAMLAGCPVIASTGGSIPEICGDYADYVPPDQTAGWAAAIDRMVGDRAHAARLSARGRDYARQFTWRRSAEQLLKLLDGWTADAATHART